MTTISAAAARLRLRYLEGLPERQRALQAALEAHEREPGEDSRRQLRALAHQLRGTAASFGLHEVDRGAHSLEYGTDDSVLDDARTLVAVLGRAHAAAITPETEILLIDDDPTIGFLLKAMLHEEQLSITQVTSAAAAIDELNSSRWAVIFVDLILPDADGRSLLTRIRDLPAHRDTPVIVLSARSGVLIRNECRMYGIDAFIEKPIDRATFSRTVAAVLDRARSMHGASVGDDPLTRLPNRLGFRRAFAELDAEARQQTVVAILAVDGFKALVDEYGQHVGDRALRLLAQSLRQCLGSDDLLARWTGEEFIIAFPHCRLPEALARLEAAAESLHYGREELNIRSLSFSAGVTAVSADEALDFVLLRVDQLLYQAKRRGRGHLQHVFERVDDQRPRLLMAEDDPTMAALLFRDLADDFDVHHEARGDLAIAAATETFFDLVLLDYQMPGKNGLEVLRALRQRPEYHDRPILLLTNVGSDAAVEAAFEAGADDYINKPHSRRALLARLSRHMGRATQPSRLTDPPSIGAIETEITSLFCDICGFTRLSASMSPGELVTMISIYFPSVSEIVGRHGGRLEKYVGDALLAVWGERERGDAPLRALRAAVEIQQAIARLAQTNQPPIKVHIGLHSDSVAAGESGKRSRNLSTSTGEIDLIERICNRAGPDEIVVSAAVVERLAGRSPWPLEADGKLEIEGKDLLIHRLRWNP